MRRISVDSLLDHGLIIIKMKSEKVLLDRHPEKTLILVLTSLEKVPYQSRTGKSRQRDINRILERGVFYLLTESRATLMKVYGSKLVGAILERQSQK